MKTYRHLINFIDAAIFNLLKFRFSIALKIELKKRTLNLPIRIVEVEKRKLANVKKLARAKKLNPLFFEQLFIGIMAESVRLQDEQRAK